MKINEAKKQPAGRRILFATFPGDGHFNPLTGLAVHLKEAGYDVRWYTSETYAPKIKKLQLQHYPFKKALDISTAVIENIFPEREQHKSQLGKLKFDIINVFIKRGPEYYEDLKDIYQEFAFDLMVADCLFTGIPFVKDLMHIPVVAIGVVPLTENSRDLPPCGLGLEPSYTLFGKIKQSLLRGFSSQVIFKKPNKIMHRIFDDYQIAHNNESVFDMLVKKSTLLLQSGTPSFEYYRSDMSSNVKFIGPLLPHQGNNKAAAWFDERLNSYQKVILVTQGTVEKDIYKLLVPTLEAFKNSDTLVICTTGGSQTQLLQQQYPQENFIIEDFIPFNDVMPYTDVYVTNGGYGGVMLGIENNLPSVVAGVHEGKNEICARTGYFKLGINLKTENPRPLQVKQAVEKVLADGQYKKNSEKLSLEFSQYKPNELCEKYVSDLLSQNRLNNTFHREKENMN